MSDSHLRESDTAGAEAWAGLVRYTERTRPDLIVHTGDLVHDDPDQEDDHSYAAFQMRRLTVPWRTIPGNHDIGDSEPDPYRGLLTSERLERYQRHFGDDRWSLTLGRWLLVGMNSQLFDNTLPERDAEQWEWFDEVRAAHPGRPLAVFIHKPPCINSLDEELVANKSISPNARRRLLDVASSGQLKMIGCGHLHEFMTLQSFGVLVIAAPSLAGAPQSGATRGLGLRCNGAVEYRFTDSGFRFNLVYSDELRASTVGPPISPLAEEPQ